MEKMMGMKGILTPDEKGILETLEKSCKEEKTVEEKKEFLAYTMGFTTAMKIVKYQMEVLPGVEFIERLEKLLKENN